MTTTDEVWVKIRDRLYDLRLAAGKPSFAQIGKDTGLHFSTVGNAMRGYSSNPPGWDTLAKIWTYLGGDLDELRALHPLTPPTRVKSEVFLACPLCSGVLELKLRRQVESP